MIRRLLRFRLLALTLLVTVLFGIAIGCSPDTTPDDEEDLSQREDPNVFVWASGSLGTTGYTIIEAFVSVVNKNAPEHKGASMATAGSAENLFLIGEGDAHFAHASSHDWVYAIRGEGMYDEKIDLYQLFGYSWWTMPPIVLASSDIETINDLKGKRVSPGPAGGGSDVLWSEVFRELGLYDEVVWVHQSWRDAYDGLRLGTVDVVPLLSAAGKPGGIVLELESVEEYRVVEIPNVEELIISLEKKNPGITFGTVDANEFAYIDEDIIFPSLGGVIAICPKISEEAQYNVVKAIFDNLDYTRSITRDIEHLNLDYATSFLMTEIPVAPGAVRYFKEKGIWREELVVGK